MIELIKTSLWEVLKNKHVSLVMIFDRDGLILWHKGREIVGRTLSEGDGFCKSVIRRSLKDGVEIMTKNEIISFSGEKISASADLMHIKHIIIQPIEDFFLYIDSGDQMFFNAVELGIIKTMGRLLAQTIRRIKYSETEVSGISARSEAMQKVKELVLKYSLEEDCILLLGETGVGKSHIAGLIHQYSGRMGKLVIADTTTINENLFESEIFGHKKGAFTGAHNDKRGLVDEAEMGTLLLDEIGEVPVSFQAKLLRLIESKKYRVLGDPAEKSCDVRIIVATNRDLARMVKDKVFREDLYYRINILSIDIPPLRERRNDIPMIVEEHKHLLKGKVMAADFMDPMMDHDWPGNFRELFAVLKRAGIMCPSPITGKHISEYIQKNLSAEEAVREEGKIDRLWNKIEGGESFWDLVRDPFLDRELNRDQVKNILSRALRRTGGRYIDTLEILNINKDQYNRFIKFINKNRLK